MRRVRVAVAVCVVVACSGCLWLAGEVVRESERHKKETGETLPPPDPCAGEPAWVNQSECAKEPRKAVPRD